MQMWLVTALLTLSAALLLVMVYLLFRIRRALSWFVRAGLPQASIRNPIERLVQLQESRTYLAGLLQLDVSQLPPMGGWAAAADFLVILAETLLARKPEVVVEFGSGVSLLVIGRCLRLNGRGKLISYDHDAAFADVTRQRAARLGLPVEVRTVALAPAEIYGYPGQWYAADGLPERIDVAVVDGPPAGFHPETRGAAGPAIVPRLASDGVLFLDDANRPGERAVVARWRREFPDMSFTFLSTDPGTAVGTRLAAPPAAANAPAGGAALPIAPQ